MQAFLAAKSSSGKAADQDIQKPARGTKGNAG